MGAELDMGYPVGAFEAVARPSLMYSCWLKATVARLYLKKPVAQHLKQPYQSRSALARQIVDTIATSLPERSIVVSADGGYSTKMFLRGLPDNVVVTGRFPVSSKLYKLPGSQPKGKRGPRFKKGSLIGTVKAMLTQPEWQPHPTQASTWVRTCQGLWHSVLPGKLIKVVLIKRDKPTGKQKSLEAFFSTDASRKSDVILAEYAQRWDVEINIRDANAFYGFGKDQCQSYRCIVGVNPTWSVPSGLC